MVLVQLPREAEYAIDDRAEHLTEMLGHAEVRDKVFSGGVIDNPNEHMVDVGGNRFFLKIANDRASAEYEIEQYRQVSQEHFAVCYGTRSVQGRTVIILEWLEPLQWVEPAEELLSCADLIMTAYCEEKQFLCQDIKLAHFGRTSSGILKLMDLDLSGTPSRQPPGVPRDKRGQLPPGILARAFTGTLRYSSANQCLGLRCSLGSDMFSLALSFVNHMGCLLPWQTTALDPLALPLTPDQKRALVEDLKIAYQLGGGVSVGGKAVPDSALDGQEALTWHSFHSLLKPLLTVQNAANELEVVKEIVRDVFPQLAATLQRPRTVGASPEGVTKGQVRDPVKSTRIDLARLKGFKMKETALSGEESPRTPQEVLKQETPSPNKRPPIPKSPQSVSSAGASSHSSRSGVSEGQRSALRESGSSRGQRLREIDALLEKEGVRLTGEALGLRLQRRIAVKKGSARRGQEEFAGEDGPAYATFTPRRESNEIDGYEVAYRTDIAARLRRSYFRDIREATVRMYQLRLSNPSPFESKKEMDIGVEADGWGLQDPLEAQSRVMVEVIASQSPKSVALKGFQMQNNLVEFHPHPLSVGDGTSPLPVGVIVQIMGKEGTSPQAASKVQAMLADDAYGLPYLRALAIRGALFLIQLDAPVLHESIRQREELEEALLQEQQALALAVRSPGRASGPTSLVTTLTRDGSEDIESPVVNLLFARPLGHLSELVDAIASQCEGIGGEVDIAPREPCMRIERRLAGEWARVHVDLLSLLPSDARIRCVYAAK
eukprot:TRINITY_DN15940_c0_g1_i1.p1 TRINITY_DN15940_c0_g1~~TRINITY_DN15940_c0_g1_i1.p1  ORF type:complete len:775 (+),score=141.13 TRINITY_DN15940_c0_g1_i1:100-2424(+)